MRQQVGSHHAASKRSGRGLKWLLSGFLLVTTLVFAASGYVAFGYEWQVGPGKWAVIVWSGYVFSDFWRMDEADGWRVRKPSSRTDFYWTYFFTSRAMYDIQRVPLWPIPACVRWRGVRVGAGDSAPASAQ
jgi:hypothetical protein